MKSIFQYLFDLTDLEAREAFAQREKEDDNKAKHNLEEEVSLSA